MDKLQFAYLPNRSTDDATTILIHELARSTWTLGIKLYPMSIRRLLFSLEYNAAIHTLINRLAEYNIPRSPPTICIRFPN